MCNLEPPVKKWDRINIQITTTQEHTRYKCDQGAFGFQRSEMPSGWAAETLQSWGFQTPEKSLEQQQRVGGFPA